MFCCFKKQPPSWLPQTTQKSVASKRRVALSARKRPLAVQQLPHRNAGRCIPDDEGKKQPKIWVVGFCVFFSEANLWCSNKKLLKMGGSAFFSTSFRKKMPHKIYFEGDAKGNKVMNQCNFGGKMIINQMYLDSFDINVLAKQWTVAAWA